MLGVATVVCCACGIGGDMMQDLKVGHILGGTPSKMQIGEILSVVVVSFLLIAPIGYLHAADLKIHPGVGGIGGENLPAPQAGLMAMLSRGIIGGEMAWPLVFVGAVFALGMILIKAPSPMLIAVGMYLPLQSTFAIFVGGLFRWMVDWLLSRRGASEEQIEEAGGRGVLVASGLIAGEALTGVGLAVWVIATDASGAIWAPFDGGSQAIPTLLMLGVFAAIAGMLILPPLRHFTGAKK
ncbi:MAG: OPT/YSL family transporter [Acidobacteriota bacterium]|nr:OPT/YSL family transporter [Acidobacteriota bacterium]